MREGKLFVLVIGTTDVSLVPGITLAGATPELTHFTPAADAEYLLTGETRSLRGVPITPSGLPTPALISRASLSLLKLPTLIANAGSRIAPRIPYVELGGSHGRDIRRGAMETGTMEILLKRGKELGSSLSSVEEIIIGESIPGGTTTAMATLLGLGYDALGKVSSTAPNNPMELKEKLVLDAVKTAPKAIESRIAWLADPVLIAVAGISIGFLGRKVLAGGTQMLAAAALIKNFAGTLEKVEVRTTKWVVEDHTADFQGLATQVGVKTSYASLNLSKSRFPGLRAYEEGYVKEGVGAGALSLEAISAHGEETLLKAIDREYERLLH
jgi:uncharacterized protein (TIGR00303 family)